MIVGRTEKNCAKCRQVKPVNQFSPSGLRRGDGYAGWCKACRCEDERQRRNDPKWIAKHREKYETDMRFRARQLLRAVGKRCRRFGWDFDLSDAWLIGKLQNGACELTGLPFDMAVINRRPNSHTPSIDRVKPELGYVEGNCRVVLFAVNTALSDWGTETFLPIAAALVNKQKG
jgi:hypothetical protein